MEKLATDIYSFDQLRNYGFTYVDKTALILPLVDMSAGKQFFLSRPRRFGKSLLISTLECLFEGRRDLFKGLAIEDKWDWSKQWPVLHLDMGSCQADNLDGFWCAMRTMLKSESERLGVALRGEDVPAHFQFLIRDLAARSPDGTMVLLVDEYDKPLLGHLCKPDVIAFRDALKQFYSVIKTCESFQRFAFITGVSKFSKVSIFSDLNNLIDLTMTSMAATILGYTHAELKTLFPETLQKIAVVNGLDVQGAFDKVVSWYDGYRFEPDAEKVINPVSFGLCSKEGKFQNYWANTATPTFLMDALKEHPLNFATLNIDQSELEAYEPANPRLVTLLFQTGYLTIKGHQQIDTLHTYDLGFPNREVENAFLTRLADVYAGNPSDPNYQAEAVRALYAGDVEKFCKAIKGLCANIPYNLTDRQNEQTWQAIIYVILRAIGVPVYAEVMTNDGRIDMTCETPAAIWLIEFKLDHSADEALAQIERNGYAEKFDFSKKRVIKVGVSFSSTTRTIAEIKMA